jgi:hypothetical protein
VTNELFPHERGGAPISGMFNGTPEDTTNFISSGYQIPSDIMAFADFMRFLAPPTPSTQAQATPRRPTRSSRCSMG